MTHADEAIRVLNDACHLAEEFSDRTPLATAARRASEEARDLIGDAVDEVLRRDRYRNDIYGWSARDVEVLSDAREYLEMQSANPSTSGASL